MQQHLGVLKKVEWKFQTDFTLFKCLSILLYICENSETLYHCKSRETQLEVLQSNLIPLWDMVGVFRFDSREMMSSQSSW